MNKILLAVILICASVVFGLFVVLPRYNSLKSEEAISQSKSTDLAARKSYYNNLTQINDELANYSDDLSKLNEALPKEVSAPATFDFFQKEAQVSGVVIKSFGDLKSGPSKDHPDLKEYNLTLSVSAPYSALKSFISTLEKSAHVLEVDTISFSSPSKKDSPFTAGLGIKFYSY